MDYYNRPFQLFHQDISSRIKKNSNYLRREFWNLIPPGEYRHIQAQDLFWSYSKSIERKAAEIVKNYSIDYWMHLSRRIGIGSGGVNKEPITININRFIITGLIQRYARQKRCKHVGNSSQIKSSEVFNGLLMSEEFEFERRIIEELPAQLVFTDFNSSNLLEYYTLENLAYELWVCGAKLRAIGKGVVIIIHHDSSEYFYEVSSEILDKLIYSYDSRLKGGYVTESGTVFSDGVLDSDSEIFIPIINVYDVPLTHINALLEKVLKLSIQSIGQSNFILYPYPIKKYIEVHRPLEKDFRQKYGISFVTVIISFSAMCFRYFYLTAVEKKTSILKILQRGYDGPFKRKDILDEVSYFAKHVCRYLAEPLPSNKELEQGFVFLELRDQLKIDIRNSGSLKLFIKSNDDYYFVDYSTIPNILNNLFDGINLNTHNYRGSLFENSLGFTCHLPTKPCKATDGTLKQIDFSYVVGECLLIGECKVVARKNSFFSGSFNSLKLRETKVVEKGLKEIDEKAVWLLRNPKGVNYDISKIKYILPFTISPFVEYIHSTNSFYWINEELPRVLSFEELRSFVDTFDLKSVRYNLLETNWR